MVASHMRPDSRPDARPDARPASNDAFAAAPRPATDVHATSAPASPDELHRLAEERLAGIISIAADAIISIDVDHRITMFNLGAEKIFGYSADEVIGQPLDILLPEGARSRHQHHIDAFGASPVGARRMGERSVIAGRRKSGETFPAEASIAKLDIGGERSFTVILRDASERRRTEDALHFLDEASKALSASLDLAETLQHVVDNAVPTLADCCTIDLTRHLGAPPHFAVAARTSVQREQLRAASTRIAALWEVLRIAPPEQRSAPSLVANVTEEWLMARGVSREARVLLQSLGVRSLMVFPLAVHGRTWGMMSFFMTDSGQRFDEPSLALARELAGRVAQAVENGDLYSRSQQAVAMRDEVLAIVSHDLRNPLSVVSMCASTLSEQPLPDAETIIDLASTMHQSAEWMNIIIQDLLDVARMESGRLAVYAAPVDFSALVESVIELHQPLADDRELDLVAEIDPDVPLVMVDAARINQVLSNLVGNALKFTRKGGKIRVSAAALELGVIVTVSDTGRGIDVDHLPRLFDRFWQVRRDDTTKGSGLGLAIAKGIVEAHGGTIWAESVLGEGTSFRFTLPAVRP
ncbi:MAG: PAS domain-containing sensor histidine kinase [Gemmatimonadaceae bacterium]